MDGEIYHSKITNVGDEAAKFHVDIRHTGGSYFLAPRELSAGETATFDLRQMQSGKAKDNKGKVLPQDITSGQFHWSVSSSPGTPKLIGRAEVVSVAERVSSSYSCPTCCPDSGPNGGFGGGATLFIDGFAARSTTGNYIDCYGYNTNAGEIYMSRMWIEHSSIASINATSGYSTEVKGLGVGETILWGEFDFTQWDTDGMDCYRWDTTASVNEPVEVIPRPEITGLSKRIIDFAPNSTEVRECGRFEIKVRFRIPSDQGFIVRLTGNIEEDAITLEADDVLINSSNNIATREARFLLRMKNRLGTATTAQTSYIAEVVASDRLARRRCVDGDTCVSVRNTIPGTSPCQ